MPYDPKANGCLCDECPLNGQQVVPPEIRPNKPLIIGEAPNFFEAKKKLQFVGQAGKELDLALGIAGKNRNDVSLTTTLLCQPPKNMLFPFLRKISKKNKEELALAKKEKREAVLIKSPLDCCKPRLKAEIEQAPSIIMLGSIAMKMAKGEHEGEEGLRRKRGFPDKIGDKKCLPTWHPAFVLRSRRWTETFRSDIAKAFRYFEDKSQWKNPQILFDPDEEQLDDVLNRLKAADKWVAIDTETDGLDPEMVNLRCIGIANEDFGVVVGFESVETPKRNFKLQPQVAKKKLSDFFRSYNKLCGHNINLYDRPVIERHGIYLPPPKSVVDTVIMSHVADSELPNDLSYLTSRYTDAPSWKPDDHEHWDNDEELQRYCGIDCCTTASLVPFLSKEIKQTNQERVYWSDIELQELCLGMHKAGMLIDLGERSRHEARLRLQIEKANKEADDLLGKHINLFSHEQVRDYLFDDLKLPLPSFINDSGDPSTNKDSIYELLQMAIPDNARQFLSILLDARMAGRSLSKDVLGLTIYQDGRVHSSWKPHSVVTGRLSSSHPNVANVPSKKLDLDSLRSMYIAAPGSILVSADLEQVELRIVSLLSDDALWLEAFEKGLDVHKINAATYFGCKYENVEDYQRNFAKTLTYLYIYSGGAKKAMLQMRQVRDPATKNRPYANLTLMQAKVARDKLLKDHPNLPVWWQKQVDTFRSEYMLRSIVLGRVRRFLDAVEEDEEYKAEIINYQVQCVPGFVRVITKDGYLPINELIGKKFEAWTGNRWAPATAITKGYAPLQEIWTNKRVALHCDKTHKLLVAGKRDHEWRTAEDCIPGQRVALDLARELEFGQEADLQDMYYLGLWLAEGSAYRRGKGASWAISWAFGGDLGERVNNCLAWLKSRGVHVSVNSDEHKGTVCLTVTKGMDGWLRAYGVDLSWKSFSKRIPGAVWRLNLAARKSFVLGFMHGDGCFDKKRGVVSIHLCQRDLLEDFAILLRTIGIDSSIGNEHVTDKKGHTAFTLKMSAGMTFKSIGFGDRDRKIRTNATAPDWLCRRVIDTLPKTAYGEHKYSRSQRVLVSRIRKRGVVTPYALTRISPDAGLYDYARITSEGIRDRRVLVPMYTLMVDDPSHSYVANGFISHNSATSDIMSGEIASRKLIDSVGWSWTKAKGLGGAGIINQCHDSFLTEVAENNAEKAQKALEEAMKYEIEYEGRKIVIPAKAKSGKRWSDV